MDPSKDLGQYGYGSIAWKEKVYAWKQRQENNRVLTTAPGKMMVNSGGKGGGMDPDYNHDAELPM